MVNVVEALCLKSNFKRAEKGVNVAVALGSTGQKKVDSSWTVDVWRRLSQ